MEAPIKQREVKLARTAMRAYAAKLLKEQGGTCPLCLQTIDLSIKGEGVIDHDHETGRIRGLLHRSCNAAEGKACNAIGQWGSKSKLYADILPFMGRLLAYLQAPGLPVIYPMHKTPDERREQVLKRQRERKAEISARRKLAQAARKATE